uniref:Uncharacterized protein n=1 Tax=Ciona intestinalis TaxID=7719 RepID=H2XPJ5_CIOIN
MTWFHYYTVLRLNTDIKFRINKKLITSTNFA